ncbi:uncharacterized protein BO97DRAFT_404151 [Aspergillus homomorphus CBS 101889]|uniref:Uncharacterized protein n=1 Tax=Aspergillus homomorphus (strain CBS 101889) TaxID=1450537 RepID=A0A395I3G3_ASPHC|nr:hypothetical protein BO97DRAFT_404151 [Aspergillus homomorphus CBS 101889]RAL14620.1 hypothetical protein BO97DRAFT_404151 [Aspergillus homomorphus CBS 101889]
MLPPLIPSVSLSLPPPSSSISSFLVNLLFEVPLFVPHKFTVFIASQRPLRKGYNNVENVPFPIPPPIPLYPGSTCRKTKPKPGPEYSSQPQLGTYTQQTSKQASKARIIPTKRACQPLVAKQVHDPDANGSNSLFLVEREPTHPNRSVLVALSWASPGA